MEETRVLCYTRQAGEDAVYASRLAYSMHLALMEEDGWRPLNHNCGVLFARATGNEDGTLNAKSLKNPWLFVMEDGSFGVMAIRTEAEGGLDASSRGAVLLFASDDLIQYEELGLLKLGKDVAVEDVICRYDRESRVYVIRWKGEDGRYYKTVKRDFKELERFREGELCSADGESVSSGEMFRVQETETGIEGAVTRNQIALPEKVAERLRRRLTVPEHVRTEVPPKVTADTPACLKEVRARVWYSDTSSLKKRVDWNLHEADWGTPGIYRVRGRIHQDHYEFPIAFNRADPCVGKWQGKYYFIATNDADGNHSLYIRQADSLPGLVTAQEVKLLDTSMYPHMRGLLWAPEFHIIRDRLYIFHAATTGRFEDEQSHVMRLKPGGDPMRTSDWEMSVRVVKKDGTPLYDRGITLDMTCFEVEGRYYVSWSQRQFVPVDQGAWLYLAEIDPDRPWQLITDPVLLSRPEYGWENNHTFVDEGPFALIREGRIFLTFSGSGIDSTYVVGLMTAKVGDDLLNPDSWVKGNFPLLTSRSVPGQYGTGHNAYVEDEEGMIWNTYHARPGLAGPRSSGIRRVHFGADGFPVLDMTEEKDLNPELAEVTVEVEVRSRGAGLSQESSY